LFRRYNIKPPQWEPPSWQANDVQESLDALRSYAEQHAQASINWYYAKKPWKAIGSQFFRLVTIVATAVGGALPIIVAVGLFSSGTSDEATKLRITQCGYLFFGLAALSLALDKFFGNSTGWMRYITTAMSIETALEQFRFEWAKVTAPLGGQCPSGQTLENLIDKITQFSATVRTLVEKETQAWVSEFQSNLSQLEKDTKAAVEAARAQAETVQKENQTRQEATRPGAIDLTVSNVLDTDAGYDVLLDGKPAKTGVKDKSCGILHVAPGLHDLSVKGTLAGATAHASQVITVPPGAALKVELALARAKSAAA